MSLKWGAALSTVPPLIIRRGSDVILLVTWRDAYFDYEGDGEPLEDYVVRTVGHLVSDGPRFLTLAAEQLPEGTYRATTHIPLENVIQRAELEAM